MGENERFHRRNVDDLEERTSFAVVSQFRPSTRIDKTPFWDEAVADEPFMLFMISSRYLLCFSGYHLSF
jgi:hypothetical protein